MVCITRDSESLFSQFFYSFPNQTPKPPVSVELLGYEPLDPNPTYSGARIQFAVAGFEEEDIEVYFEGRTLVVEGDNIGRENISEKFKCSFSKKISIRENLDLDGVEISLKNGILDITMPIKDPKKNRTYILGGKD